VLVDFTEKKLEDMFAKSTLEAEAEVLWGVLDLYKRGIADVEWIHGQPFVTLKEDAFAADSKSLFEYL